MGISKSYPFLVQGDSDKLYGLRSVGVLDTN